MATSSKVTLKRGNLMDKEHISGGTGWCMKETSSRVLERVKER